MHSGPVKSEGLGNRARSPACSGVLFAAAALLAIAWPDVGAQARTGAQRATDSIAAAIVRFNETWFAAWSASELERAERELIAGGASGWGHDGRRNGWPSTVQAFGASGIRDSLAPGGVGDFWETRRTGVKRCSPSNYELRRGAWPTRPVGAGWSIRSQSSWVAVCPTWYLDSGEPPHDERLQIDNALLPAFRARVVEARERLLQRIDSAAIASPDDNWLAGQRVRFLVDQGALDRALNAALRCGAAPMWCAALAGYVHAFRGELVLADSAFDAAARNAGAARCDWLDIEPLLEPTIRADYLGLTCPHREQAAERFWWLADPLWSEPGNDRRVEHFVRRVGLLLKRALPRDERWDWRPESGGDARAEMVIRYGWPSVVSWGGPLADANHEDQTAGLARRLAQGDTVLGVPPRLPANPYTTYEYSRGRIHLAPVSAVVLAPFTAKPESWSLSSPPGADTTFNVALDYVMREGPGGTYSAQRARDARDYNVSIANVAFPAYARRLWWPVEHYAAPRMLRQLPEPADVFLRRDTSVVYATATALDPRELSGLGDDANAVLIATHAPDSLQVLATTHTPMDGAPLVLFGNMPSRPTLVGVEIQRDRSGNAWRTRFAATPPPSLAEMRDGEVDLSDIVLLRVSQSTQVLPTAPDSALRQMAASAVVAGARQLGVYWETYGINQDDSVEVNLTVEGNARVGLLRRAGVAFGIMSDPNVAVSVSWQEPRPEARAYVIGGRVPIVGRSMVVDLAQLAPGEYQLAISVRTLDGSGRVVARTRDIVVR